VNSFFAASYNMQPLSAEAELFPKQHQAYWKMSITMADPLSEKCLSRTLQKFLVFLSGRRKLFEGAEHTRSNIT
jgi:hypothetical protein